MEQTHIGNLGWQQWENFATPTYAGAFGAEHQVHGQEISPTQNWVDKYETKWGEPLNTPEEKSEAAVSAGHYNRSKILLAQQPGCVADVIYNQSPCQGWTDNKAQLYYGPEQNLLNC